jgi:kynurenine 3-monooxygenase
MQKAEKRVTLVGAGLVGSLLSIYLARRGYRVDIYERRPDMRREAISAGRSINLAISTRGLSALNEVGLKKDALRSAIPMKGRMMHPVSGELVYQAYGKDDSQYINSISRGWLNKRLLDAAEETGRVQIHFNSRVSAFNSGAGILRITHERNEDEQAIHADVVIGTDGSASVIRDEIVRSNRSELNRKELEHGYKELLIPASANSDYLMEKNALHIWPRGSYMLIALPNPGGSFTVTLFLPFKGEISFESLSSPEAVIAFFRAHFPDALSLITPGALTEDFFKNPVGTMVTVKCAPWSLETKNARALVLGDAAHAIVPFFGQGMNCGFEDCAVLDKLMEENGDNWNAIFSEFGRLRKPNADAIADMAVENFVEMRDKVADPAFLMEKQVEKILQKEFPGEYVSRYSLVSFSTVPYRKAYEAGTIQASILKELCDGLAAPEQVDLSRARALVTKKLAPFMKGNTDGF